MISASSVLRPATVAPIVVALLTFSPIARAQIDAGREDVQTLEKSQTDEAAALNTADCANACRALASIRRAAEKICTLDHFARCEAARARADEATRRVREACPDCVIASAPTPAPPKEERAMGKGGSGADRKGGEPPPATLASSPPAESQRGGCRSCTTTGSSPGDLSVVGVAIAALAFTLRRRRPTTRSR